MTHKIIYHSKPTLNNAEVRAIASILKSGHLSQGDKVEEFEKKFARYIGKKYAVAVNSGTSALHLSLMGLGVKKGDEVILPSYTCDALLNAVLYTGATPIIVDVDYEDGNISPLKIKENINRKTKAVIVPHNLGFPARIDEIVKLGIPVIEDCATSIGSEFKGKKTGSFGKISVFSFYATKMLTTGEGGMAATNDERIVEVMRELRDYTGHKNFQLRFNYKMTDLQAALGLVQLKKLGVFLKKRSRLAERYECRLRNIKGLVLLSFNKRIAKPSFYRCIAKLITKDPQIIKEKIKKFGIICGNGVLMPLHRLLRLPKSEFRNSERLLKETISLPIYPSLENKDVNYICDKLIKILENDKTK